MKRIVNYFTFEEDEWHWTDFVFYFLPIAISIFITAYVINQVWF